jgi:membrane protein DedA with SNARE-associated domain
MLSAIINVTHLVETSGYPLLFVLVMSESGGVPIPGETALIAAAVAASQGTLSIEAVIPLAAAAAIVGDNIGYLIGRKGGRWLLERPGPFYQQRLEVLARGEPFFERHGPKAVFFGRFVLGLRVWASWLAGATRMRWRSFALWNALGGITWASAVGIAAYELGHSAGGVVEAFGLYGLIAVILAVVGVLLWHRRHRRAHPLVGAGPRAAGAAAGTGAGPEPDTRTEDRRTGPAGESPDDREPPV